MSSCTPGSSAACLRELRGRDLPRSWGERVITDHYVHHRQRPPSSAGSWRAGRCPRGNGFFTAITSKPWLNLLLINVFLLVLGTFMETTPSSSSDTGSSPLVKDLG